MNAKQLRKAGETLARNDPGYYGRGWQSALARMVGVRPWTVSAWLAGRSPIRQAMGMLIERLVEESKITKTPPPGRGLC